MRLFCGCWPRRISGARSAWIGQVIAPQTVAEVKALQHNVARGTPFGSDAWVRQTADTSGLESTLRPRGRPKKGGVV